MISGGLGAGIEGLGDVATGALAGRAFEPGAGEAAKGETGDGGRCLNCGTALAGAYCHRCGQPGHIHRSLAAFWHDLAHGVLHFEGKIWRTLPLLAWRPGDLTRRYVEGERARFVSPMALFLFSVFLMVAVFHWVGPPVRPHAQTTRNGVVLDDRTLAADLAAAERKVTTLEGQKAALAARHADTKAADKALADARGDRDGLRTAESFAKGIRAGDVARNLNVHTGLAPIDQAAQRIRANPELVAYKFEANAYKFSWALIPISVPFVWLLFLHRRRYRRNYHAFDHTVFVTYSLSFMTLLMVVLSFGHSVGISEKLAEPVLTLVPPVHIYRQLRGAYRLSWFAALWRAALLILFAFIALTLFLLLLLAIGVD